MAGGERSEPQQGSLYFLGQAAFLKVGKAAGIEKAAV